MEASPEAHPLENIQQLVPVPGRTSLPATPGIQHLATMEPTVDPEDRMSQSLSATMDRPSSLDIGTHGFVRASRAVRTNASVQHLFNRDRQLLLHGASGMDYLGRAALAARHNALHFQGLSTMHTTRPPASIPPNLLSTLLQPPSTPSLLPQVMLPQLHAARLAPRLSQLATHPLDYLHQPPATYDILSLRDETPEMRAVAEQPALGVGVGARNTLRASAESAQFLDGTSLRQTSLSAGRKPLTQKNRSTGL